MFAMFCARYGKMQIGERERAINKQRRGAFRAGLIIGCKAGMTEKLEGWFKRKGIKIKRGSFGMEVSFQKNVNF